MNLAVDQRQAGTVNHRILVANAIAVLCVGVAVAATPVPPRVAQVLEAVRQGKPVSLIALYEDDESFGYVMDRIAEASEKWLDVASRLAPTADAHPGEELANALAFALANAPERILSRSFEPISLEFICRGPFEIEDEGKYRDALQRSLSAVSAVKDAKLAGKRDACLRLLKEVLAAGASK